MGINRKEKKRKEKKSTNLTMQTVVGYSGTVTFGNSKGHCQIKLGENELFLLDARNPHRMCLYCMHWRLVAFILYIPAPQLTSYPYSQSLEFTQYKVPCSPRKDFESSISPLPCFGSDASLLSSTYFFSELSYIFFSF